jgi:hypothetical protein
VANLDPSGAASTENIGAVPSCATNSGLYTTTIVTAATPVGVDLARARHARECGVRRGVVAASFQKKPTAGPRRPRPSTDRRAIDRETANRAIARTSRRRSTDRAIARSMDARA